MAAGVVHVPWYATGFRSDDLGVALERICPISLRYGATGYHLYRARDDRYRFIQTLVFERKLDWERYWDGPEFIDFRVACQGWYQVPVIYGWHDLLCEGSAPSRGLDDGTAAEAIEGSVH